MCRYKPAKESGFSVSDLNQHKYFPEKFLPPSKVKQLNETALEIAQSFKGVLRIGFGWKHTAFTKEASFYSDDRFRWVQ